MAVTCQCGPQEFLTGIQKFFLFWMPINPQKDWKVKLERAHFSTVQSGKITVWSTLVATYVVSNKVMLKDFFLKLNKNATLLFKILEYITFFSLDQSGTFYQCAWCLGESWFDAHSSVLHTARPTVVLNGENPPEIEF